MNPQFNDDVKKLTKNHQPISNPYRFWKTLDSAEDAENVSHYCSKLFLDVLSQTAQDLHQDHEAMYATLFILEFYKNTKVSKTSEREKDKSNGEDPLKYIQDNKTKVFQHARWVIDMYLKLSEEMLFAKNFISHLCHIPTKLTWKYEPGKEIEEALDEAESYYKQIEQKKQEKRYKMLKYTSYPDRFKETKIIAFAYCCFLDYIRSSNFEIKKSIYVHILDLIKGLIHAYRATLKTDRMLTVLLHLLEALIKFYGCPHDDLLKEIIYYVNLMRSFPGKNSDLAYDLFQVLHAEVKCPGQAFRKEIRRKFVAIDAKKAEDLASKKFLITSKFNIFNCPEYCTVSNLRKLVILNILGCCRIENLKKLQKIIEPLDVETTFSLYYKIMKIVDIAVNLQTYESIQKLLRESINDLFKLAWTPFKRLKREEEEELEDLIIENPCRFFQFPNSEIIQVQPENLMSKKQQYSLYQIFESAKDYPFNQYFFHNAVDLIFIGSDSELNELINDISQFLLALAPKDYQKLSIYLVPIQGSCCSIAEYISYKDLWYKRFVYDVFKQRVFYPNVSLEEEIKQTFPAYLFNKTLHMYLREAPRKLPIRIFKIVITTLEPYQEKILYFFSNIIIGASLECQAIKNQKEKDKKTIFQDYMDIYLEKVKKNFQISVNLRLKHKEQNSQVSFDKIQQNMQIEDLQICNTPKEYFFGNKPNPMSDTLELSILTTANAKLFKSEMDSKQNFKRYEGPQLEQAFKDLFVNLTIETIIVERPEGVKQPMRIMVDGIFIPKVDRLRISPALTEEKLPYTLPIKCFLPFEA